MDDVIVISYDNKPTENTRFFESTLLKNNWKYVMIGEGEIWLGFTNKLNGYMNYIKTLEPNQLIILSDARDVVCLRGPKAFLNGFNSFNKDMVVSMELLCGGQFDTPHDCICSQCTPLTEFWNYHEITVLPDRKYVNSGLVAGKASAVLDWLEWSIANNFKDDQLALGKYINAFPNKVGLDTSAILLHTTNFGVNAGIQSIHIQKNDSPTFAELFGRGAFFLHIPGCGFKGQETIYKFIQLNLEVGASDKRLSGPYNYAEPNWDEIF
jgi:hypothetical protein